MRLSELTYDQYKTIVEDTAFWDRKIADIIRKENLPEGKLSRFSYGSNIVYSLNHELVIKLFPSYFNDQFDREVEVLRAIAGQITSVETPKIISVGNIEGWNYLIMTELKGTLLIDLWDDLTTDEKQAFSVALGKVISEFHRVPPGDFSKINVNWQEFIRGQFRGVKEKQADLPPVLLESLETYVDESYIDYTPDLKLLTGEYTPFNLLFNKEDGKWTLTGVIDFADCFLGDGDYDLLGPILFMFNGDSELISSFLKSYGYEELNESLRKKLMTYTILHRYSDINYYIAKNGQAKQSENFEELSTYLFQF
ncbi:phosphotransferase family protein [Neobacillus niacini]|uniref:phosphotransferase family protein n=1 Tax=Neobacillus niacini TaxID=86668 RepID=UPI0021CB81CF|nr:aminoglycoside 3'-phosphotransferase/choline kinase family protein [Neobacillus niacini]MCM3764474.1 aminoglycoside 3'-phosphotransferase/choline kinase family protein [Neobacillus niacini]